MKLFGSVIFSLFLSAISLADSINVAAAISLKEAIVKIADQYRSETGTEVSFTFGSSGTLAAQIQNGAPVDLFISAASKQVDDLVKNGRCDGQSVKTVARNSLVLIIPEARTEPGSIKVLGDAKVDRIAIGEPKSVPAGMYAEQSLKKLNLYDQLKDKLVFAANVRQVLDYVERGEVSAGLVYSTDAIQSGDKVKVVSQADPESHDPIIYPAVVVRESKRTNAAKAFMDYLVSEKGAKIFKDFGFAQLPNSTEKSGQK